MMDSFSKRLKTCREKLKAENSIWTQGYVAKKLNVARTTYTAYENGTKTPPLDTVNRIANLFNVSSDFLLGRTENPYQLDDLAAHRSDDPMSDLPEDARREVENFMDYIRSKYGKKDNT